MLAGLWNGYYCAFSRLANWLHNRALARAERMQRDIRWGRRWYGNDATFSYNLMGRTNMAWARRCSGHRSATNPNNPLARQLHRDGYATLTQTAPAGVLQQIAAQYRRLIDDEEHSIVRTKFSRMVFAAQRVMPSIRELLTPEMKQVLEDYYGSYFKVVYVCFYRTEHIPPEIAARGEAFSNHWHCDRMPTDLITIMTNLGEVTGDDGPFLIQSRARTRQLMRIGFRDRSDYNLPPEVMEDEAHVVRLIGPVGTTMLCDNQCCLHRASIPGPGRVRDIGSFQVAPSHEPLRDNWLEQIEFTVPEKMFLERKQRRAA
jgi:hypothetical protein